MGSWGFMLILGWAQKKWRLWIVVLEKMLESPLDCKEIKPVNPKWNQPWIFIGNMLMLKLKIQYFGHLIWRADSLEKTLMLGKNEGRRRRGWQRMRWLESIADSTDMNLRKLQEIVKDREAWRATVQRVTKSRKRPCDWITKRFFICLLEFPALQVRQLMFLSFAHFRIRIVVLVSRTLRVLKTCQIIPAMETLGSFQLKYHNLLSKLLLLLSRFSRVQLCATA